MVLTRKRQLFFGGLAAFPISLLLAWGAQSPWWLVLTAVSLALIFGNRKSLPARRINLFGTDMVLFEAPPGATFEFCFDDVRQYIDRESGGNASGPPSAHKPQPGALIGPFRWMADIAARAVGISRAGRHDPAAAHMAEQNRRELREIDYIQRLTVHCNGCKTPITGGFKRAALTEAKMKDLAGADIRMMGMVETSDGGTMPTRDGRCPKCGGETALYVWGAG